MSDDDDDFDGDVEVLAHALVCSAQAIEDRKVERLSETAFRAETKIDLVAAMRRLIRDAFVLGAVANVRAEDMMRTIDEVMMNSDAARMSLVFRQAGLIARDIVNGQCARSRGAAQSAQDQVDAIIGKKG